MHSKSESYNWCQTVGACLPSLYTSFFPFIEITLGRENCVILFISDIILHLLVPHSSLQMIQPLKAAPFTLNHDTSTSNQSTSLPLKCSNKDFFGHPIPLMSPCTGYSTLTCNQNVACAIQKSSHTELLQKHKLLYCF